MFFPNFEKRRHDVGFDNTASRVGNHVSNITQSQAIPMWQIFPWNRPWWCSRKLAHCSVKIDSLPGNYEVARSSQAVEAKDKLGTNLRGK